MLPNDRRWRAVLAMLLLVAAACTDLNDAVSLGYVQEMTGDVYVQPVGGYDPPVPVAPVPTA